MRLIDKQKLFAHVALASVIDTQRVKKIILNDPCTKLDVYHRLLISDNSVISSLDLQNDI